MLQKTEGGCNMKVIRLFLSMSCIAALCAGCSKELPEPEDGGSTDGGGKEEVQVSLPEKLTVSFEEVDARTLLNSDMKMAWHPDDAVSYFTGTYGNVRYLFDGVTGDSQGTFSRVSDGRQADFSPDRNYAVYPYDEDARLYSDGSVSFTFPSTQTYSVNSFAKDVNVMLAVTRSTDDHEVSFRNCCGYLRLQLYGEDTVISLVAITGNGSEPLAGKSLLSADRSGEPEVSVVDEVSASLLLDCGDGVELGTSDASPASFWFVIPPTEFEQGLTVTVTDTAGRKFRKTICDPVSIGRNIVLSLPAFEVKCEAVMSFADIAGTWELDRWQGSEPPFEVCMEIAEDGTVVLYQKIEDFVWEKYESTASLDFNVISGIYSDGVPWSASYDVRFDGKDMVWTNVNDENDVSVYVKTSFP